MESILKSCEITLKTISPIHIGSGETHEKASYIVDSGKMYVFEGMSLLELLTEKNRLREYENFVMAYGRKDLAQFFRNNYIDIKSACSKADYAVSIADRNNMPVSDIMAFARDPYGMPYVAGSSIKGALRTVIESAIILSSGINMNLQKEIDDDLKKCRKGKNDKKFLKNAEKTLTANSLHSPMIITDKIKETDLLNDIMKSVIVSDSKPLSNDDLCVCRVTSIGVNGNTNENPEMYVECLKPGVEIHFDITFDYSILNSKNVLPVHKEFISPEGIEKAIRMSFSNYMNKFGSKFSVISTTVSKNENVLMLGKFSGFASKTEEYSLYDEDTAKHYIDQIIDKSKGSNSKALPFYIRHTKINGKMYPIGYCEWLPQ